MSTEDGGPPIGLTDAQRRFFEMFGFLRLRGLFRDEIQAISSSFDDLFARTPSGATVGDLQMEEFSSHFEAHARIDTFQHLNIGRRRAIIPDFVDRDAGLAWIRHDPRVLGLVSAILGPNHEYAGGDGNIFSCDTAWHCDLYGTDPGRTYLKVFFYLDELDADSGALRVIAGSNHAGDDLHARCWQYLGDWEAIPEALGVSWEEIPAHVVHNEPGDVLLGDFRTFHATIGSGHARRLFTLNFSTT